MACSSAPHTSIYFMRELSLPSIELELKKRYTFPYTWFRKQNDPWDSYTNFIYSILEWKLLLVRIKSTSEKYKLNTEELFYYAINRWYNFWSAMAVEHIFTEIDGIEPALIAKHGEVDFIVFGINFDHKTSVFPKHLKNDLAYAKANESKLIAWLYKNQSTQKRHHLKNRLFIVVHDSNGEHWKLKAEIGLLKLEIEKYITQFSPTRLHSFTFAEGTKTLSDIIWVIK